MTERSPWDFTLPDQTCAGCGLEHPGEGCTLQDGLPLTWCPLCDAPADHDGQCFPAQPPAAGVE